MTSKTKRRLAKAYAEEMYMTAAPDGTHAWGLTEIAHTVQEKFKSPTTKATIWHWANDRKAGVNDGRTWKENYDRALVLMAGAPIPEPELPKTPEPQPEKILRVEKASNTDIENLENRQLLEESRNIKTSLSALRTIQQICFKNILGNIRTIAGDIAEKYERPRTEWADFVDLIPSGDFYGILPVKMQRALNELESELTERQKTLQEDTPQKITDVVRDIRRLLGGE